MEKAEERTVAAVSKKYGLDEATVKCFFMKEAGDDFKEPVSEHAYKLICETCEWKLKQKGSSSS